jgi:hypothetical protein
MIDVVRYLNRASPKVEAPNHVSYLSWELREEGEGHEE